MNISIKARPWARKDDYFFLCPPTPDEVWLEAYTKGVPEAAPTLVISGQGDGWHLGLWGIPAFREDESGTATRFELHASGGGGTDADSPKKILDFLVTCLWEAQRDQQSFGDVVGQKMASVFTVPEVEEARAKQESMRKAGNQEESRKMQAELEHWYAGACDRLFVDGIGDENGEPVLQVTPPDWIGGASSPACVTAWSTAARKILMDGSPGAALFLTEPEVDGDYFPFLMRELLGVAPKVAVLTPSGPVAPEKLTRRSTPAKGGSASRPWNPVLVLVLILLPVVGIILFFFWGGKRKLDSPESQDK